MPKKIRVYELARELGLTNKEALDLCLALGIGVKSHSSSIEDAQADRVRRKADSEGLRRAVSPEEPAEQKPARATSTRGRAAEDKAAASTGPDLGGSTASDAADVDPGLARAHVPAVRPPRPPLPSSRRPIASDSSRAVPPARSSVPPPAARPAPLRRPSRARSGGSPRACSGGSSRAPRRWPRPLPPPRRTSGRRRRGPLRARPLLRGSVRP